MRSINDIGKSIVFLSAVLLALNLISCDNRGAKSNDATVFTQRANEALLKKIGLNMEDVLGKRPGEALNCIHSGTMKAGCGTSKN